MFSQESQNVAHRAESIYQQQLKSRLEPAHADEFVAIEPIAGDYFLGKNLSEAIGAARKAYPDRLAHAIRIGHPAAIHFGTGL